VTSHLPCMRISCARTQTFSSGLWEVEN